VQEEVDDDLLEARGIAVDEHRALEPEDVDRDAAEAVRVGGELRRAPDDAREVRLARAGGGPREAQEVAHDLADPREAVADEREVPASRGLVAGVAFEEREVVSDPLEGIVDLVRDPGGQEADRGEALVDLELLLHLLLQR